MGEFLTMAIVLAARDSELDCIAKREELTFSTSVVYSLFPCLPASSGLYLAMYCTRSASSNSVKGCRLYNYHGLYRYLESKGRLTRAF